MTLPRKIILFDIDGTLLLTGGAGKMAFDRVFAELFGIEGAWKDIHPDGRTDPDLIRQLFQQNLGRKANNGEYEKVTQAYILAMQDTLDLASRFRLMPGVQFLLAELQKRNLGLLGLATGNLEATAYQKLTRASLRQHFTFGGFGSDSHDRLTLTRRAVERGRQKLGRWIDPEDIFLVGDTVHDIRCGKQLGITTLAVATGSTGAKELAAVRPDFLLENLEHLEEVLPIFE